MTKRIVISLAALLLLALPALAQSSNGHGSGSGGGCIATVSALSSSCGTKAGTVASVTDGSTASDCTVGGGTNKNACIYSGSAWAFAGSAGSAPTFAQVLTGTNTGQTHTVGSGGTFNVLSGAVIDFSAIGAGTFKVPSSAAATASATKMLAFDSTAGFLHGWNGADTIWPQTLAAVAHKFLTSYTIGSGIFTQAQPSSADLSDIATLAANTAANLVGCAGSTAGDICYYNSGWNRLPGNASGTKFLQESSAGTPSWAAASGATAWDAITAPAGNLALSMGSNTSIFSTTSGVSQFFAWKNTTAALVGASQSSPLNSLCGTEWHSSASVEGCMAVQFVPGTGTDAANTFSFTHTGGATGITTTQFPGPVASGANGTNVGILQAPGNTSNPTPAANAFSIYGPASASFTGFAWQFPTAENGSAGIAHVAAAASHISAITVSQVGAADVASSVFSTNSTAHQVEAPLVCADSSASGTAQVCNTSPTFTPAAGDCVIYTTTTANTGTGLTLNVNSLGAKSVAKWQAATTLAANDVLANKEVLTCYDGTNWELHSIGNAPAGGGSITVNGAGAGTNFSTTTPAAPTANPPNAINVTPQISGVNFSAYVSGFQTTAALGHQVVCGPDGNNLMSCNSENLNANASGTQSTIAPSSTDPMWQNYLSGTASGASGGSWSVTAQYRSGRNIWADGWFETPDASTASTIIVLGFTDNRNGTFNTVSPTTSNAAYIRFANGTDTNYAFVMCNAAACNAVDSTVAYSQTVHQFSIHENSTGPTWTFCIDSTCSSALATDHPTTATNLLFSYALTPTATITAKNFRIGQVTIHTDK